ncbi:lipopolysaccharide assembly LapA domain-containing protein [Virgibacillus soli]|uniref:Lipopolysaccharide assembly protein LapA domain-containing protein n=1 Tax=Paracerasibacillus soli TaxID=480284 RepID=A0ABU5CQA7_9BACI|nr:lipopolysaccharide assembly protein LapA domain-containing protein [Virgibacillus soli]MDY0408561.1 lipopolysaccharide assembly protein LapA domain-containing protein [Virgibacillus soli]
MKGQVYIITAIVLTILIAVFAVINVAPVEVNYFFWTTTSPLILVILFSVLMGGVITGAFGMIKVFQLNRQIKTLKKENNMLQQALPEETVQNEEKQ